MPVRTKDNGVKLVTGHIWKITGEGFLNIAK